MIHGRLDSIVQEIDPASPLGLGLKWLEENELNELEPGYHKIDGERVFAIVTVINTRPEVEAKFEVHHRYSDIQVVIEGAEVIGWADREMLDESGLFDDEKDVGFYERLASFTRLQMTPGLIAVFRPGEAHMPLLHPTDELVSVRKVVVKVDEALQG